jgi:hypothetical protein
VISATLALVAFLGANPDQPEVGTSEIGDAEGMELRSYARTVPPPPVFTVDLADRMSDHAFWLGMAMAGDLGSTAWALRRCAPCSEGNPLGPDVEARVALKMAGGTAAMVAAWKLEKGGHSDVAKGLRWGVVAVHAIAIVINSKHAITRR